MSFHTIGFMKSLSSAAGMKEVTPLDDGVLRQDETNRIIHTRLLCFAGFAMSPNLTQVELRAEGQYLTRIRPFNTGSTMPSVPNFDIRVENPIAIPAFQHIILNADTNSNAEICWVFLWLTTGLQRLSDVEVMTVRGTVTQTIGTQNTWTELNRITWDPTFPPGRYAVLGSEHYALTSGGAAGNALMHRWIFDGQLFRPGAPSQRTSTAITHELFYRGSQLGVWGTFQSPLMPRCQVFSAGTTDNQHFIHLYVAHIG